MELLEYINKTKVTLSSLVNSKTIVRVRTIEECKEYFNILKICGRIVPNDKIIDKIYNEYKDKTVIELDSNCIMYDNRFSNSHNKKKVYNFSNIYIVNE